MLASRDTNDCRGRSMEDHQEAETVLFDRQQCSAPI